MGRNRLAQTGRPRGNLAVMEAKPGELVNLGVGMRAIPLTRYDWREEGVNLINKLPPPSHWAELLLMISLQPKFAGPARMGLRPQSAQERMCKFQVHNFSSGSLTTVP